MNFVKLATSGLRRNRMRVLLNMLSISFAFALFGVLVGVDQSFDDTIVGLDSDSRRLFVASRVSQVDQLPLAYLEKIKGIKGVRAVVPSTRLLAYFQDPANWIGGFAVEPAAEFAVYDELRVPVDQIRAMSMTRTGAIVGRQLAEAHQWKIGDKVPLISPVWQRSDGASHWVFDLVGIYDAPDPSLGRSFLFNYAYFNEARAFARDTVGTFIVGVEAGEDPRRVSSAIDEAFANSADETLTLSGKETRRNRLRQLGDIKLVVTSVVGATLVLLFFLIANEMRQSMDNRVGEFAMLRAIGFTGGYISALVVAEALILMLSGAVLGFMVAAQMITMLPKDVGEFELPLRTLGTGFGIAITLALASALVPALRASRLPLLKILHG
jgi:putative ABC transport system permease protein